MITASKINTITPSKAKILGFFCIKSPIDESPLETEGVIPDGVIPDGAGIVDLLPSILYYLST